MRPLVEEVVEQTGLSHDQVQDVITKTFAHIHKGFFERSSTGSYGGYVGGPLTCDIGSEAYYHFIGMLVSMDEDYFHDEPRIWSEYAKRLIPAEDLDRYEEKIKNWKRPKD